jgi:hypothetical protein
MVFLNCIAAKHPTGNVVNFLRSCGGFRMIVLRRSGVGLGRQQSHPVSCDLVFIPNTPIIPNPQIFSFAVITPK